MLSIYDLNVKKGRPELGPDPSQGGSEIFRHVGAGSEKNK
jgi:hypothetical protein